MNRRAMLGAGAAALFHSTSARAEANYPLIATLLSRAGSYDRFLTLGEIEQRRSRLLRRHGRMFTTSLLGQSRSGRPINLVSLHGGAKSALVVAGVHANEPYGSLTVDLLAHLLANDDQLRRSLDTTWHFVDPIDPDGLVANEGWLHGPLTIENYFEHFFRPAVDRQPDYNFPLQLNGYSYTRRSPESVAFQSAIDETRPNLLYPLHNSEASGAFFLLSRSIPCLEGQLRAAAAACGLRVGTVGEPLSELVAPISSGVWETPRPTRIVSAALAGGVRDVSAAWPYGAASMEYAEQFGALSLVVEAPYWDASVPDGDQPSDWNLARVIEELLPVIQTGIEPLERWNARIQEALGESEMKYSLAEAVAGQRRLLDQLPSAATAMPPTPLSRRNAIEYRTVLGLMIIRAPAMMRQLAGGLPTEEAQQAQATAAALIRERVDRVRAIAPLENVHIPSMVALQAASAIEAVRAPNQ